MKKKMFVPTFCLFMMLVPASVVLAGSMDHSGHSMDKSHASEGVSETMDTHAGHDMTSDKMDHDMDGGNMEIRSTMINGYHLTYRLIDMKARMKGMEDMPEMKATHHLMLFVKSHGGETMGKGRVGFLIENPDGTVQKGMAMGMSGGYGADVSLDQPGDYTIKVKALVGEDKLVDQFSYGITAP